MLVRLPATLVRLIPAAALLLDVMLVKVAARVPLVRLRACPLPVSVTSLTVRVPKLKVDVLLILLPVVLAIVKPRRVLPEPRLTA